LSHFADFNVFFIILIKECDNFIFVSFQIFHSGTGLLHCSFYSKEMEFFLFQIKFRICYTLLNFVKTKAVHLTKRIIYSHSHPLFYFYFFLKTNFGLGVTKIWQSLIHQENYSVVLNN